MKEDKKNQPQQPPVSPLDKEPGKPGFQHGNTAVPKQEVFDEDAKAEQDHEKLKQDTDDETKKVVNEQEQEQVVNNDQANTETKGTPKMAAK